MDFQAGIRKRHHKKLLTDNLADTYPHDLQMYTTPPGNEITLTEFEDLAIERLQLLRTIEQASFKGDKLYSQEWKETILTDIRKQKLANYVHLLDPRDGANKLQARRADHISHFILRLVYCRSENLRRWFLMREQEWFKIRFMMLGSDSVQKFLLLSNLTYKPISTEERDGIRSELYNSTSGVNHVDIVDFYKVPFMEVPSLVRNRKVLVTNGFAYVPNFELVTSILCTFRTNLSEALAYASHKVSSLDDDRLNNLLTNLHTSYTGRDYSATESKESIDITHLDHYARDHFPLCMRHMHEMFRATHTMKHNVRLQYGLFIKGIGVSFEDAMRFWRDEFTKAIDEGQFEKRYAYHVKHSYGRVGSRTNYTPFSCMKIITDNVGPGEHHGCPFRHFDAVNLKQKLIGYGISNRGVEEILDLTKNMHYQIACTKYFELVHGQPSKNSIIHPNQYFEESRALLKKATTPAAAKKSKTAAETPNLIDEAWIEEMEL